MAVQIVSRFGDLDRFVAEVTRRIEADDPTAEVRALDFRAAGGIMKRNPKSGGTHSLVGRSDEGYDVRGAADLNVYRRGTNTPHPDEWDLLNKHAKPYAKACGLAYTFPYTPKVWLRSHSGSSLHFHVDVSVWGTDYGDCYAPFRKGKGGYYRQSWAGRPTVRPPKIQQRITLSEPAILKLQKLVRTTQTGTMGSLTITGWQRLMNTTDDGIVSNPSGLVLAVQRWLNQFGYKLDTDGRWGPKTQAATEDYLLNKNGAFYGAWKV